MERRPAVRLLTLLAALVVWSALGLQLALTLRFSWLRGNDTVHALMTYFGFFTVLTNLLVALALTVPMVMPRTRAGRFFTRPGVATMAAASIVLVGLAYFLLLRHVWHPTGWVLVADVCLHYVMPLLFLGHWWLAVSKQGLHMRQIVAWSAYPVAYFALVMLRGAFTGRYPYYFLDAGRLGYISVLLIALAILAGYIAIGLVLIAVARATTVRGQPDTAQSDARSV